LHIGFIAGDICSSTERATLLLGSPLMQGIEDE
jgi:hypothetical protein